VIPVYRKAVTGILAATFALTVSGSALAPPSPQNPYHRYRDLARRHASYSGPASAYGNIGKGIAAYFSYVTNTAA